MSRYRLLVFCTLNFLHKCLPAPADIQRVGIATQNGSSYPEDVQVSTRQDLSPTLERTARSFGSREGYGYGYGGGGLDILPLLLALQPTVTPPAEAASPLTALLPFLLGGMPGGIGGYRGGGSSFEGRGAYGAGALDSLLPLLVLAAAATPATTTTTTTTVKPSGLMMNPKLSADMAELQLADGTNISRLGGGPEGKRYPSAGAVTTAPHSNDCALKPPRSAVCDDLPLDKILALKNGVVVMKGRKLYRVRASGEPFDLQPTVLPEKIDMLTATATIGKAHYVFQGDKVTKYDAEFRQAKGKYPKPVSEEFPGVITPVDGVFQLNNHTYVFASGTKFVYFQPDNNPNVDPRYSPQYLDNVPGVPSSIDSAFTIKNRKFLHKQGTIFEMASDEMKAIRDIPVSSSLVEGWLKCPDIFPTDCLNREVETQLQATEESLPMP